MDPAVGRHRHLAGTLISLLALLLIVASCRAIPSGLFGSPGDGGASSSPAPTLEPSPTPIDKTLCASAADLRADVAFLRSLELREDGLLAVLVAAESALGEARTFLQLVDEEYRPAVSDLVSTLEGLRVTIEELEAQETVGAQLAGVGEAITEIGEAMDALALQLREPCPEEG